MTKLEAYVKHYSMWELIVKNPDRALYIKADYVNKHDPDMHCICYLCEYFEDCRDCPLIVCDSNHLYYKFKYHPSIDRAIAIRDVIFNEYKCDPETLNKLKSYCNHYAMWDNIVVNPYDYTEIKSQYTCLKGEVVECNCYLCDYYETSCHLCPLRTCGKGSKYRNFMNHPTSAKAIEIRDIIFKDNFI